MMTSRNYAAKCLLIPRIEIVAWRHRRGQAIGAWAVRPAAAARETLSAFEAARAAIDLRLRSGDERRQAIDADAIGNHRLWLWLRLKLRLRTMLAIAAVFAGRMLLARLVGLSVALLVARRVVARHERLLLRRDETRLLPEIRKALALVVAILRGHFILGARLWLVLTELFLGGGDQAKIMLGMLIVILGGHRIARAAGVARQLDVFFGDVRCGAANLDVGSVGLEHPRHRVLAAPVVIIVVVIVVVVPVAHPLVIVLTVSHVLPLFQPWIVVDGRFVTSPDPARVTRTESQRSSIPHRFCRMSRSAKTRSPAVQRTQLVASNYLACQNKHRFLA